MYFLDNDMDFLNPAKYIYWDDVFTDEEIGIISDYFSKTGEFEKSKIGIQTDGVILSDYRKSYIKKFSSNEETLWIFNRFNSIINFINEKYFRYDLFGYKYLQYSEYPADIKGQYNFHMDILPEVLASNRKLSVSFLLNEPGIDFEGGEFKFTFSTPNSTINPNLKKGRMVFFPSWLIHCVEPVTKGVRKSVVIWVEGPNFK